MNQNVSMVIGDEKENFGGEKSNETMFVVPIVTNINRTEIEKFTKVIGGL